MKNGFTLLELSIVLVIIGLIIGGITVGADLIRAAELNSVVSDANKYKVAVNTFKLKYNELPGDMDNAEAYWGQVHATAATCETTTTNDERTCNGDGNGEIDVSIRSNEFFRFWQHLSNAEIISGSFTGVKADTSNAAASIDNVPQSQIEGLWMTMNLDNVTSNSIYFDQNYGNTLMLGGPITGGRPYNPLLKPSEAEMIDTKIDDGTPGKGKLLAVRWNDCTDATSSSQNETASYLLSSDTPLCAIIFQNIF